MEKWVGRVAFVTGASAGIGAAITKDLVKAGLTVVGFARRLLLLQKLADDLKGEKGVLHPIEGDITKEEDIVRAFQWVDKHLGEIHILVNNAGIFLKSKIADFNIEDWNNVYRVNVFGLGICTREAVKLMEKYDISDGHIININSVAGHKRAKDPAAAIYTTSKRVVTDLCEYLKEDFYQRKKNIKVTSISPGLVETEMSEKIKSANPDLSALQSSDISNALIYILSTPQSVHITELTIMPTGSFF